MKNVYRDVPCALWSEESKNDWHNKALLGKWPWRFTKEMDLLWRKLIMGKFGEELGGWCSCKGEKIMELVCGSQLDK